MQIDLIALQKKVSDNKIAKERLAIDEKSISVAKLRVDLNKCLTQSQKKLVTFT